MKRLKAAFAITVVITSFSTVGATVSTDTRPAESGPTAIDSCTTINESGRYVVTQDITPFGYTDSPCIQVTASDVVIDGQGHTVIEGEQTHAVSVGASDRRLSNVTVKNIDVGWLYGVGYHAVTYEGVDGGAVTNVTAVEAVVLADLSNISVREGTFHGGDGFWGGMDLEYAGIVVANTSDAVIARNILSGFSTPSSSTTIKVVDGSRNTTIRNNRLLGCPECRISTTPLKDLIDNRSPDSSPYYRGISIGEAVGTTVVNNTIRHYVTGIYLDHGTFAGDANETTRIANNTVRRNVVGLQIDVAQRPVAIRHNEITANGHGIYTPEIDACEPGAAGTEKLQVHRNDIANNSQYGILNERAATLNATRNYWGDPSGPSSANDSDAPFADPVTGTLADGEGDVVSEHPEEPGLSNVRFDSWLNESAANASADSAN